MPARDIQAVAAEMHDGTRVVWLANLTGAAQNVTLDPAVKNGRIFLLDADSFVAAAADRDAATILAKPFSGSTVKLKPYGIAKITGTIKVTSSGQHFTVYLDSTYLAGTKIEAEVDFESFSAPVDAALQADLVKTVARRVAAA